MPAETDWTALTPLIARLSEHEVDFILIGGAAGSVYGSAFVTYDVDVAYGRDAENLERLAEALRPPERQADGD